jgi:hypothetical protein
MQDWTKVVTDPLGLVGFTLFLLFGAVARLKRDEKRSWVVPVTLGMAVLALASGLTLAFLKQSQSSAREKATLPPPAASAQPSPQQMNQQIDQKTTGPGSPAVQGVQGNVTINVDQSGGTWKQKPKPGQTAGKTAP